MGGLAVVDRGVIETPCASGPACGFHQRRHLIRPENAQMGGGTQVPNLP